MSDLYQFGQFVLDSYQRTLSRAGSPVFLTPKALDVLLFLVRNPNRLVTKEELLRAVWVDTFVEEGNLAQYISHLRKALAADPDDARLIVTIARKGYQFTGRVNVADAAETAERTLIRAATTEDSRADPPAAYPPRTKLDHSTTRSRWWKTPLVLAPAIVLVVAGLVAWRSLAGAAKSQKLMLAVLPFQNLTGDADKEYLADGLTEQMISQLGRLDPDRLGVIARTSVMGYKHKDERLDQIGRDLSVEYVLESSLRENGDHLRFTAQLIQVKDQTHLWSKDYDYPANNILAVEDDVAQAVAQEIRLRLTSQQRGEVARSYPANPQAFDAYLKAFYFFQRNTDNDTEMAAKYYQRATQLDPSYASAWVGLSRVRNWQVNVGVLPADEGRRLARQAGERALALNPNLAEAHAHMARLKAMLDFDWAGAAASSHQALALEPGNPEILRASAGWAEMVGHFDEADQLGRRAADLDPLNPDTWSLFAQIEYDTGRLDRAAADAKKALDLSPDVWPGAILLSKIYVTQGHAQDALREIEHVRYEPQRAYLFSIAHWALGRRKESDAALNEFVSKYPGYSYQIATIHAFRNETDDAFAWLDRAYAQRNTGLVQLRVDPFLKNLHDDPRYAALLKKLNFPQ